MISKQKLTEQGRKRDDEEPHDQHSEPQCGRGLHWSQHFSQDDDQLGHVGPSEQTEKDGVDRHGWKRGEEWYDEGSHPGPEETEPADERLSDQSQVCEPATGNSPDEVGNPQDDDHQRGRVPAPPEFKSVRGEEQTASDVTPVPEAHPEEERDEPPVTKHLSVTEPLAEHSNCQPEGDLRRRTRRWGRRARGWSWGRSNGRRGRRLLLFEWNAG